MVVFILLFNSEVEYILFIPAFMLVCTLFVLLAKASGWGAPLGTPASNVYYDPFFEPYTTYLSLAHAGIPFIYLTTSLGYKYFYLPLPSLPLVIN